MNGIHRDIGVMIACVMIAGLLITVCFGGKRQDQRTQQQIIQQSMLSIRTRK